MSVFSTAKFVFGHPLNKKHKVRALLRVLRWQGASRLIRAPIALPFIDSTRLLVKGGMAGATGNWYCGLHELDDMGFALHFHRPEDTFFDVGANIGSYTILASGASGARTVAIEPVPESFRALRQNVQINMLEDRVSLLNAAVGSAAGHARFTSHLDAMNRTLRDDEVGESSMTLSVTTIDQIGVQSKPTFMKIDVEGSELQVLKGATNVLTSMELRGLLVEINGSGRDFGVEDKEIHSLICGYGFAPMQYDALRRVLKPIAGGSWNSRNGNTLYLRDVDLARRRIAGARTFDLVNGRL